MNSAKQAGSIFLSLILLAGFGWYFAASSNAIKFAPIPENAVDSRIFNLSVKRFDEQGVMIQELKTPKLEHIPYQDTHILTTPDILASQKDKGYWLVRSKKATSIHGGEQIDLSEDVVAKHFNQERQLVGSFLSNSLRWLPKQHQLTSDDDVTYEQAGSIIQSKGMIAWLDSQSVKLLHHARAFYKANQHA